MMLKLVVLVALVAAANGASCPAVCLTCFAGGAGGGTSLVGGVCHASCSTSRYCGTSDAYTNGGTDCTGCAETPTASQRANLKLADAHYVTNTKASIAAAELLYKQTVVEFSALFNAGSLLTKSAKKRYNYILAHDSRKPAAEQALLCEDSCSPGGTYTGTGSFAACTANYCDVYQVGGSFRNRCTPGDPNHNFALLECQKTCNICADKTPYAASELSSLLGRRSNDQCSDGEQNGDETGVDCGGSCSVCPVDCVFSETTCTCTSACGNTCDCTDTITITTPAVGRGQACPSATVRTFAGAACPPSAYVFQDSAALKTAAALWTSDRAAALTTYGHISTNWDTSKVTNMRNLFKNTLFNDPIGAWNTAQVTNMYAMFYQNAAFNQPIGAWDTSKVTDLGYMFGAWDTSKASAFNQPIGAWDTSKVKYMKYMFLKAAAFNQPIGAWDTSKVTNKANMLMGATAMTYPMP